MGSALITGYEKNMDKYMRVYIWSYNDEYKIKPPEIWKYERTGVDWTQFILFYI